MISRSLIAVVAAAAVISLDACGGGGGSPPSPARATATPSSGPIATPTASPTSSPTATPLPTATPAPAIVETFAIAIPAPPAAGSSARRRAYVSPNTNSVRISVTSVNGHAANLAAIVAKTSAGSPGCITSLGGTTCTVSVPAALGTDVFAIAGYASVDGSGATLESTTVAESVTATNSAPVALTLAGVPSAIAFSPPFLPLVNDGEIHRFAVTVNAVDASGAAIVGASTYQSPVDLEILGDPTHALSLSSATVQKPGTTLTVTFDGSKGLTNGSIAAAATGVSTVSLLAAPLSFSPQSLLVYDDQTSGAPTTVEQAGFTGSFTAALADPADGNATVTGGPLQSGSAVVNVFPKTTLDDTALDVNNGTFTASIPVTIVPHPGAYSATGKTHVVLEPSNLVEGPNGLLWTDDQEDGSVLSYDVATGAYTSYVVDPSDSGPTSIAFDSKGTLWFADQSQIGSFDPATKTVKTYSAGLGPNAKVLSIVAGAPGTMWFYDEESNAIPLTTGKPSAFGTIATATGAIKEFSTPASTTPSVLFESMALGPDGALWYADGINNAIGRVTASGAYSSVTTTSPSSPNLTPDCVVAAPDGNIWFLATNQGLGQSFAGYVNPSTRAIATFAKGIAPGEFDALIVGSDGHLWYAERPFGFFGFSSQGAIGVTSITAHVSYTYTSLLPNFSVIGGIVDRGDRTLFLLDNAYGQIGKVPFK